MIGTFLAPGSIQARYRTRSHQNHASIITKLSKDGPHFYLTRSFSPEERYMVDDKLGLLEPAITFGNVPLSTYW